MNEETYASIKSEVFSYLREALDKGRAIKSFDGFAYRSVTGDHTRFVAHDGGVMNMGLETLVLKYAVGEDTFRGLIENYGYYNPWDVVWLITIKPEQWPYWAEPEVAI
jgi:hypothetical protein